MSMPRTDQTQKTGESVVAWILTIATGGYLLPWAIAATRGKSNSGMTGVINLLLGWTIVGWIWALVRSLQAHNVIGQDQVQGGGSTAPAAPPNPSGAPTAPAPPVSPAVPAGWYPDPQGTSHQRYWDGSAWTEHTAPLA